MIVEILLEISSLQDGTERVFIAVSRQITYIIAMMLALQLMRQLHRQTSDKRTTAGGLAPQIAPELRLLTLAARPGYPGCTARRWSWLRVREAIRQTGPYKLPGKPSEQVRKLRFNTLLHPQKKTKLFDC